MGRILSLGSINLDEVFSVPHFIRPGETMACRSYERFTGGKGNNQSTALGRAGADVHHAGKIGPDGSSAVEMLKQSGVDVSRVMESQLPTGRALIQVDEGGQNCIILYGGANRDIAKPDVDAFLEGWGRGDSVLFQNEISALHYAMEEAKRRGLRIFLNPSPADEIIATLPLETVDCLIVNELEGAMLAGMDAGAGLEESPSFGDEVLERLRRRFPHADLVLTLGAAGARWRGADEAAFAVPASKVVAVDSTAAGDTFTGYLIAALLRGDAPRSAMGQASAAAGICVTRVGAVPSIPWLRELP